MMGFQTLSPPPLATSANDESPSSLSGGGSNGVRQHQLRHQASLSNQPTLPPRHHPPPLNANQLKAAQQQQQHLPNLANNSRTTINCFFGQNSTQRNNYSQQAATTCYNHQYGRQQQVFAAAQQAAPNRNPTSNGPPTQQQRLLQPPDTFSFGNSRAPITKALQNMVNQQHQHQATFVINSASSRHPIRGCALPPIPVACNPVELQQSNGLPNVGALAQGSISSASSMTSISSVANSSAPFNRTSQAISGAQQMGRHFPVPHAAGRQQQQVSFRELLLVRLCILGVSPGGAGAPATNPSWPALGQPAPRG